MVKFLKIIAGAAGAVGLLAFALPAMATLTLDATSVTSGGALTLDGSGAVNLGGTNATSLSLGNLTAGPIAITLQGNPVTGTATTTTDTTAGGGTRLKLQYKHITNALTGDYEGLQVRTSTDVGSAANAVTGAQIKAVANDVTSQLTVATLRGVYTSVDPKDNLVTTARAFEASLDGSAGSTITEAVGLEVMNNSSGAQTAGIGVSLNGGTASGHKAFTKDFRLQNAETIDNATNGTITFGGNYAGGGTLLASTITENTAAADGTRYNSFVVNSSADPASGAEATGVYGAYNWSAGTTGNFIVNGVEGVARSTGADESGTFRGGLFRTYTNGGTMRTAVGLEASARTAADTVAESGTAFVGSRIWMAPYFSAGTVANVNNFYGLWLYNESTTNTVTGAIKINDAGTTGWTYGLDLNGATIGTADIRLHNAATIDNNTSGIIRLTGAMQVTATSTLASTTIGGILILPSFSGTPATCNSTVKGSVFFNTANNNFEGCDGTQWARFSTTTPN